MNPFDQTWRHSLDALAAGGRLRQLRPLGRGAGAERDLAGRKVVDFSSNDYLGLSDHPTLIERARAWTAEWGTGARASRLVTGELPAFAAIEDKLARGKGAEAALILGSGFQLNATVLPALLDAQVHGAPPLVFADRLIHASLHHGCQAAGVRQIRFRHNDLGHLEELLAARAHLPGPRMIITETVFSMDGDRADVPALVALAERWRAFLYLDEAHATGVLGADGFGLAAGLAAGSGLVMGTFSKALGGFGAYLACSRALRDYLINRCSGLIYSTALPPPVLGAIDAALDLIPTLGAERARLAATAQSLRDQLAAAGFDCGPSTTQIVPVLLGDEERALRVATALEDEGLLGVAIRPPTVPPGTARLRFAVSTRHDAGQVARLVEALTKAACR